MSFSSFKPPSLGDIRSGFWSLFLLGRQNISDTGITASSSIPTGLSDMSGGEAIIRRETRPSSSRGGSSGGDANRSAGTVSKKEETAGSVAAEILISIILSGLIYATGIGIWNLSRHIAKALTGAESEDVDQIKSSAVSRLTKLMQKRGRPLEKPLLLTAHESHIAEDIIDPDDMDASFRDIGGLDNLKQEIWELAVLPLLRPELFKGTSKLVQQPSGILLYGKPGTGKTMLAKAVAKESKAVFIPIKLSKILNKWVGESNKLVAATFSLACKLAPSIIFIDELDTFLSDTVDPSASKSMESVKAEFLTLWDGITTNRQEKPVLVLGATNRPQLLDPAILRRLPRSFAVPLPKASGREQIIRVLFQDQELDGSAEAFLVPLAHEYTQGYSGSDLKELCKAAAFEPVREVTAEEARRAVMGKNAPFNNPTPKPKSTDLHLYEDPKKYPTSSLGKSKDSEETLTAALSSSSDDDDSSLPTPKLRPVSEKDLRVALKKVKRTGQSARDYGVEMAYEADTQSPRNILGNISEDQLQQMMQYFQTIMQQQNRPPPSSRDDDDGDNIDDVPPPRSE